VAVSNDRYSIFSWPPRTHRRTIDGSAPSANSLQNGHSRSPYHLSVTRAAGWPRVFARCGTPASSALTARAVVIACGPPGLGGELPPPAVTTITASAAATAATTIASRRRRVRRTPFGGSGFRAVSSADAGPPSAPTYTSAAGQTIR
jgi:hypothetical protein